MQSIRVVTAAEAVDKAYNEMSAAFYGIGEVQRALDEAKKNHRRAKDRYLKARRKLLDASIIPPLAPQQ